MLFHFFHVIPAHSRLVLSVGLDPEFAAESGGVVLLGRVLFDFFFVLPADGTLKKIGPRLFRQNYLIFKIYNSKCLNFIKQRVPLFVVYETV